MRTNRILMSILGILLAGRCWAHGTGKHHHAVVKPAAETGPLKQLSAEYDLTVRPVITAKCSACHGGPTTYPWYYKIPGVKQLIDHDVTEAKEHLDFSKGFPFQGHGSIQEDLKALEEDVREGDMPPFLYGVAHPGSKLSATDRDLILKWISQAQKALSETPSKP